MHTQTVSAVNFPFQQTVEPWPWLTRQWPTYDPSPWTAPTFPTFQSPKEEAPAAYFFEYQLGQIRYRIGFQTHAELMEFIDKYHPNLKPNAWPTTQEDTPLSVDPDDHPVS